MRHTPKYVAFFLCVNFLLAGCGTATDLLLSSLKSSVFNGGEELKSGLSDNSYADSKIIKVDVLKNSFIINKVNSEPAYLVMDNAQGQTGVWLTPAGETFRITDQGRLVGSSGVTFADWGNVRLTNVPSWIYIQKMLEENKNFYYSRSRDLDPGGYAGIKEKVTISKYDDSYKLKSNGLNGNDVKWFVEKSEIIDPVNRIKKLRNFMGQDVDVLDALPDAIFAVSFANEKNGRVIYSKQCLSKKMCFEFSYQ